MSAIDIIVKMFYNVYNNRGAPSQKYPGFQLPELRGKGAGAEVGSWLRAVLAKRNKIRFAVAEMRRAILFIDEYCEYTSINLRLSAIGKSFFIFLKPLYRQKGFDIMKNTVFKGVGTAIITPMTECGVDFEAYGRLIDWQVAEGVNAIIAAGTTGEGSTLTDEEHREVIKFTVDRVGGKIPVIAGTGSNDIAYAVELTKYSCEAGADAMLVVTPYYNKATQNGLITSFTKIADESTKPIILYNVPSRTGCNILPKTARALAEHPNIVGIKEASGNISQIAETISLTRGMLDVYSGNDDQIVPLLSLGGKGVISVLSNVMPKKTVELCDRFFRGDIEGSAKIQLDLLNLINALFSEVNPIPVKAAMSAMGFCKDILRLPLTPMESQNREKLLAFMREAGIEV